jgi:hypothetical protein
MSAEELAVRLEAAHEHCRWNRAALGASDLCGCFSCLETYPPSLIDEWCDEDERGVEQTAICPGCSVDAVLASASGVPLTPEFLAAMHAYWFRVRDD